MIINSKKVVEHRGPWMLTNTGKMFYPQDPRPGDIDIDDIANGLAKEPRYGGQSRIELHYSVAEHCVLLAKYALQEGRTYATALVVLMHDAAEAYLKDMPRAVKCSLGPAYTDLESKVQTIILGKFGLLAQSSGDYKYIKEIDARICENEKPAIMLNPRPWANGKLTALPGVSIYCWERQQAKGHFLASFFYLQGKMKEEKNGRKK